MGSILPYIDTYDPYSGLVIEDGMVNVSEGLYPCMEGQHFRRTADNGLLKLINFEWCKWHPKKVISGVIMEDLGSGEIKTADIIYFLEALKDKRLRFYAPENKKNY